MSAPTVRLEAVGVPTLILNIDNGFVVRSIDLGDAETRVVSIPAPDADGTIDSTTFIGARTITLAVALIPSATATKEDLRRRLRAFTAPRITPYLFVAFDGLAEQQIQMRRSLFSNLVANPGYADAVVQWVAPLGVLESAASHSVFVYASDPTPPAGRTYPLTFPRTYPAASPTGVATITNAGNTDAYPLLRLYGPATEPIIESVTQGKLLQFSGLTINTGEFLEVNTRTKTILLNGDPTASSYNKLLYPNSEWWTLSPGDNLIKYRPATFTATLTVAEVVWRDTTL